MKWRKLDWFNIIKQLFILGLGYSLLRMGIIMLNYYGIFGKTLLPQPGEVAILIIAGRLFEHIHSKLTGSIQRQLTFFFCIFCQKRETVRRNIAGPFYVYDFISDNPCFL